QGRTVRDLGGQHGQTLPAAGDERRVEQQVARQIAHERQLRRDGQVHAGAGGRACAFGDEPRVAREVADGRVELEKGDFHRRFGEVRRTKYVLSFAYFKRTSSITKSYIVDAGLLRKAIFQQHPERAEAGGPGDLFALVVPAARV